MCDVFNDRIWRKKTHADFVVPYRYKLRNYYSPFFSISADCIFGFVFRISTSYIGSSDNSYYYDTQIKPDNLTKVQTKVTNMLVSVLQRYCNRSQKKPIEIKRNAINKCHSTPL